MTECLLFSVSIPVIVCLVMSVVLVEGVVQVTVSPVELGNNTKEEGHLGVAVRLVVVTGSDGVQFLVNVRVHDLVTEVVVGFLPHVLGHVTRVEVNCCHI